MVRPWLFLFPGIFALGLYLAYPVFETLLAVADRPRCGRRFRRLANYSQMFGEPKFWEAMSNNMLWLIVVPAARPPSASGRAAHRPILGRHRQVADLHADGDLLRRRRGDLQAGL
jgi:hypothetical protein